MKHAERKQMRETLVDLSLFFGAILSVAIGLAVALAIASSTGCSAPQSVVEIKLDIPDDTPADVVTWTYAGAEAWLAIDGVDLSPITSEDYAATPASALRPVCPDAWWMPAPSDVECILPITIVYRSATELDGYAGLTAGRVTYLDDSLRGAALESVAAHEIGHSLWNSADHLPPGEHGIMMAISEEDVTPTDDDRAYIKAHTDGALP